MSKLAFGLAAALATSLVFNAAGALADGSTIRIEPRAYHGAVVTLEAGVRVFRPLPPTSHVIINPDGTPLNIGISEKRVYQHSNSYNVHDHRYSGGGHVYGVVRGTPSGGCIPAVGSSC